MASKVAFCCTTTTSHLLLPISTHRDVGVSIGLMKSVWLNGLSACHQSDLQDTTCTRRILPVRAHLSVSTTLTETNTTYHPRPNPRTDPLSHSEGSEGSEEGQRSRFRRKKVHTKTILESRAAVPVPVSVPVPINDDVLPAPASQWDPFATGVVLGGAAMLAAPLVGVTAVTAGSVGVLAGGGNVHVDHKATLGRPSSLTISAGLLSQTTWCGGIWWTPWWMQTGTGSMPKAQLLREAGFN